MSDTITTEMLKALILGMESQNRSIEKTNEVMQNLSNNVGELVIAERERIIKDERQKEINDELRDAIHATNDNINLQAAKIDKVIEDWRDTIVRTKRFHAVIDGATMKIIGILIVAILALLGFNFGV